MSNGDKIVQEWIMQYKSEGMDEMEAAAKAANTLRDGIESLGKAFPEVSSQSNRAADSIRKLSNELGDVSSEASSGVEKVNDYTIAFKEMQAQVRRTSDELKTLAIEDVVTGGTAPYDTTAAEMSLKQAKEIIAIREAEGLTAEQVARRVVAADIQKTKSAEKAANDLESFVSQQDAIYNNYMEGQWKADKAAADKSIQERNRTEAAFEATVKKQDALYNDYMERQWKADKTAADRKIAEQERAAKESERIQSSQSRIYNDYMEGQWKADQKALQEKDRIADEQSRIYNDYMEQQWKADQANSGSIQNINALRYANYDLGRSLLGVSAAIEAASVGTVVAFAKQERAFADVERTAEGALGNIREELKAMSTKIPLSFVDLSAVATLGNQLGIATDDLKSFTETIAQFSTITGISYDQSAQAFGKLGNLLNVGAEDYDRLASSIAYVGRTTAATESQIISVAAEIAPAAASAGFAADEVVALSGALSSLRVPPERSRSTILQFFETLNTATANGGKELENFAYAVGVTSEQLAQMVRSGEGTSILQQFVNRAATNDTIEMTKALQDLGLAGLRTNPTIRALAGDTKLLNEAFGNSKQAWSENVELQNQMSVITETLSAQWSMFVNSLMNGAASIGSSVAPTVGQLLTVLTDTTVALTKFFDSAAGQGVIRAATLLAQIVAGYLAVRGAVALAHGSVLALKFVMDQLGGKGILSGIAGIKTALLGAKGAADGAATSAFTLSRALRAVGTAAKFAGRALILGAVFQYIADWIFDTGNQAIKTGEIFIWLSDTAVKAASAISAVLGVAAFGATKGMRDLGTSIKGWGEDLEKRTNTTEDFSDVLNQFNDLFGDVPGLVDEGAGSVDGFGDSLDTVADKLVTVLDYAGDLGEVFRRSFDLRFGMEIAEDSIQDVVKGIEDRLQGLKDNVETIRESIKDTRDSMQGLKDTVGDTKNAITDVKKAMEDTRATIRGIQADIKVLKAEINGLKNTIGQTEYFLSIAIEYGDTARAEALEALLAKQRADLAKKTEDLSEKERDVQKNRDKLKDQDKEIVDLQQKLVDLANKLTKAQEKLKKQYDELAKAKEKVRTGLKGNTDAARDNRKSILDLVKANEDYLRKLAESGASQEVLAAETARLKEEFYKQAAAMGFSRSEVDHYAAAFDDFATVINNVPRNVSTHAEITGLDPALAAIKEFVNKSNAELAKVGNNVGGGSGGGGGIVGGIDAMDREATPKVDRSGKRYSTAMRGAFINDVRTKLPAPLAGTMYDALWSGEMSVDEAARRLGLSGRREFLEKYGEYLPDGVTSRTIGALKSARRDSKTTAQETGSNLGSNVNYGFGSGVNFTPPVNSGLNVAGLLSWGSSTGLGATIATSLMTGLSFGLDNLLGGRQSKARKFARDILGFQEGGYTGAGAASAPAGIVHRGEYVIPKRDVNQSTGLPNADALGRLMQGSPSRTVAPLSTGSGSSGAGSVTLSAQSIQALAQVIQPNLYINDKLVGQASSQAFSSSSRQGAN